MWKLLLILVFFGFGHVLKAQEAYYVTPIAKSKLKKVNESLTALDWEQAKILAEHLVKQYPEWPEAWRVYAEVYQQTGDLRSSESAVRQLVKLDSLSYPEAFRWIAEWTFNRGQYAEALKNINRYFSFIHDTLSLPYRTRLLHSSIRFALGQKSRGDIGIPQKQAGLVNTSDDEYFPSLSVDGSVLVFTRQTKAVKTPIEKKPQEDLYYLNYSDSAPGVPQPFAYPINTTGNEGTQSIRQDGRLMFFTACSRPDTKGGCDIYYCVKSGEKWSHPVNLGNPVNSRYWESTPFLAPDGKTLYFSSNRPGGHGGMDIWQVTLQPDKSWSPPKNLGASINSPLDEMSPILLVDGRTFFFASNGQVGMGGFDLYVTDLSKPGFSDSPKNLGYMLNTNYDEDGITINAQTNTGLFASNRDSLNGKDIYQFDASPFIPDHRIITLTGKVTNRLTGLPLGARVDLQPHGDSLISSVDADPVSGIFLLGIPDRPAYRLGAVYPGFLPYSQYFSKDSVNNSGKVFHSIELEPIEQGAAIILENIFFAFNSFDLLPESGSDLAEILNLFRQNPGIMVEIAGYTDNVGTDEYNIILSQKRAESVMKYLISRGINPGQMIAKGYGRSGPIATNETEEGRRLNRRTEIKVIRLK
ncbi:MAG: OmpA family protein [Bacteroidales bacterium]|jgi:outer membrane protein OmpA-like peptidoglycan-associated protein